MERGGSIVNVSSVLGLAALRFLLAAYAASKAGVLGLTRDLAAEWSGLRGIRVNALCPGYFDSEMTAGGPEALAAMVAEQSMLSRFATQDELDAALLFLASPASSYVTGTTLVVDGGLTAYLPAVQVPGRSRHRSWYPDSAVTASCGVHGGLAALAPG
jgi:NAD(P)-dependent dehydrogenase (short-subunit alcohol dehydrogenase family)